jgi:hypothetical protein
VKFPLIVNDPLSVTKGKVQGVLFTLMMKLLVPRAPPLLTVRLVTNPNISFPELSKVAFHAPLILLVAVEFDPHPESATLATSNRTTAMLFIKIPHYFLPKRHLEEGWPERKVPGSIRDRFRPKYTNPG